MNLDDGLKKSLTEAGYITAMPVQEQVIQKALEGADVYVQSQTGTGKTAAYLIVIMQRMLNDPLLKNKKALIMVPTRELAVQVEDEAKIVGKYCNFKTASFYGGVGYGQQQASLRDDVQIMVGTPGRILDLNSSGSMNLMDLGFLVLDEADRMFDMGFYPDLRKLIKVVPPAEKRQTMLFSATLNAYVKNLAWEYTKEPVEIEIEPEHITVNEITQLLYHVQSEEKFRLLLGILEREKPETAIIFCNTKRYTEIVSRRLRANGFNNEYISGDLPQLKRLKIIDNMKSGNINLLIATDVAARGLDIEGLDLVINYDLPIETENYVHRIGRTARAGKTGKAITLASEQDVYELSSIEKFIEMKIPSEVANSELLVEDKSHRPERHDDRHDRRDRNDRHDRHDGHDRGERHDNRRDGRGRSQRGGPRKPYADEKERQQGGNRYENKPFPTERRGDAHKHKKGRQHREGSGDSFTENKFPRDSQGNKQKLSSLNFDERVEYYKQKYEQNAGKPAERAGGKKESGKGKYGDHGKRAKHGGKQTFVQHENAKPEKTGLLARIVGIFKKKDTTPAQNEDGD